MKVGRELFYILVLLSPELLLYLHHVYGLTHHLIIVRLVPRQERWRLDWCPLC